MINRACGIFSVFLALLVSLEFIYYSLSMSLLLVVIFIIASIVLGIFTLVNNKKNIFAYIGLLVSIFNISYIVLLYFALG